MLYDPRRVRTRVEVNGRPHPVRSHRRLSVSAICPSVCSVASARTCSTSAAGSTTQVRRCDGQRTLDLTRRTATPADGDPDHVVAEQGDILDEQPQHSLAVARRRARVIPDARQVGDQRHHLFLHLGRDGRRLGLARTRIRLFGLGQPLECLVPVALQVVGHEPILGPHEQKLPLRPLGVLPQPGDLRPLGAIDLGGPVPQFVEHLDGHVDRRRGNGLEHELADRAVDRRARQSLARRLRPFY